ncbi:MAG: ABC transporter transmembrane domain-containing protein, partial [Pirellulaceae bacterium]
MNGLLRVFLLSLRYRFTLTSVAVTALLVGVLWGTNISVVYPFIEVVVHGKTIHHWVEKKVADSEAAVAELENQRPASESAVGDRAWSDAHANAVKQLRFLQWLEPWVKAYTPSSPFRTVLWLIAALLLGSLLKDLCFVANMLFVERLVQLVIFDLRKQFYRQTLRLDAASFGKYSSSELLASFTNDIACLAVGLNNLIGKAIREPLRMVACLAGAAYMSWQLLLVSMMIAPPCLFLMKWLSKSLKRNSRKSLAEVATLFNRLTETFTGLPTVKAFTMEQFERARFHETTKSIYQISMRVCLYTSLTKPVTELFGVGVVSLALVTGSYLVLTGETTILGITMCSAPLSSTDLLLFFGMLAGVADPARKMSDVFSVIANGAAAAERLFPILDREPTIVDPKQPCIPARPHARLIIENVSFHYQPGQPVLRDVSLSIPFGETIAIVGPNGCGKTTLINLLLRFY